MKSGIDRGGVGIKSNGALTGLSGLENLMSVEGNLDISDNMCLPEDAIELFHDRLQEFGFEGNATMENNGAFYPCN